MAENEMKRLWNAGRMSLSLDNDTHIETVILLEKPVLPAAHSLQRKTAPLSESPVQIMAGNPARTPLKNSKVGKT